MLSNEPHKSPTYIPKRDLSLAQQLTFKKYLTCRMEENEDEMRALDYYLRHHRTCTPKSEQMLSEHPEYQKLLSPYFRPLSKELEEWASSPYEHNTYCSECLTHKTSSGIYVRSKSESIIDTYLFINKIPFRYECELSLGSTVCFPTFTIRHPATGEVYYWEHFDCMDDPKYAKRVAPKLNVYISHGIIPSINLITTYESSDYPLDSDTVRQIVEHYFL